MKRMPSLPLAVWIGLLIAIPLVGVFLLSLAAATVVAGIALGAYYLLRPSSRDLPARPVQGNLDEIELSSSDFRRLPSAEDGDR